MGKGKNSRARPSVPSTLKKKKSQSGVLLRRILTLDLHQSKDKKAKKKGKGRGNDPFVARREKGGRGQRGKKRGGPLRNRAADILVNYAVRGEKKGEGSADTPQNQSLLGPYPVSQRRGKREESWKKKKSSAEISLIRILFVPLANVREKKLLNGKKGNG